MATTTTFSNAMKTKFIGPIRDQLSSNKVLLFGLRTKNGTDKQEDPQGSREFRGITADAEGIDFVGNEFRIPLRTGRNQGVGARSEDIKLPAPGSQSYKQISDPLRHYYGLFSITGQLLKASESNEGAFTRALTAEMEGVTDDLKRAVNIDAYGDGTGALATATGVNSTVTVPVSTTLNFQVGEYVQVYTSGSAVGDAVEVTGVNRSGLTITLAAARTTANGSLLVRASTDSTQATPNNDYNMTINGLSKIVDSTGALHGLNPATTGESFWKSTEIAAGGAVVGDSLLRQLKDEVGFESGSDKPGLIITTRGIRNRYANTLTSMKRYNDADSVKLRGGFTALMFDDVPMVVDDHCPVGSIFYLDTDALFWSQMSDWEWLEEDGNVLKWEPRFDRYIAVLFKYCNLGTWARNRHGKITGAADDTK